jgi:hypothetical protein
MTAAALVNVYLSVYFAERDARFRYSCSGPPPPRLGRAVSLRNDRARLCS